MDLRTELKQTENLLMRWPRSIRLQLKARALRGALEREEQARYRNLRGMIRRRLMDADMDTLARLARELVG